MKCDRGIGYAVIVMLPRMGVLLPQRLQTSSLYSSRLWALGSRAVRTTAAAWTLELDSHTDWLAVTSAVSVSA